MTGVFYLFENQPLYSIILYQKYVMILKKNGILF